MSGEEGELPAGTALAGAAPTGRARRSSFPGPIAEFVLRRLLAGIATWLVASLLIFIATNALPGDVASTVLGKNGTPELAAKLRNELGLNRPLLTRYGSWLGDAVEGNLGQSAAALAQGATAAPVSTLIATPLLNSFVLATLTIALLIPLSLILGTIAAVRAGRVTDYTISYGSLLLGALPEFVLGTFLILIFFSALNLFPPVALVSPGTSPLAHVDALVLPVLTLLGTSLAFSARQLRAAVIEALREDYVTMARLSGLPERRVLARYALRNALATSVQTFAQSIQYLFGGIIIVEALFAYPGIGSLLVQAVSVRDVTEVSGIALTLAATYIAVNILADLVVVLLVPRLRTGLQ